MDKLQTRIREVEEEHAGEIVARHLEAHTQQFKEESLVIIGAIRASDRWATLMSSGAMKALIRFQQEKRHEAFGYERFADFLSKSEHSPMGKAQFYERKALFDNEGERLFDIFGELGLSINKRRLLGKGNVEIDGDNAIIRDENGEETIVPIDDHARLMEVVTAVVDAKIALRHKFDRQKETVERQKNTIQETYDHLDRVIAEKAGELGRDPHSLALANLVFAYAALREEAAELPVIDRAARKDNVLEIIARQSDLTRRAYRTDGTEKPVEPVTLTGDSLEESIEDLDSVDLNIDRNGDGDNEAELAARM